MKSVIRHYAGYEKGQIFGLYNNSTAFSETHPEDIMRNPVPTSKYFDVCPSCLRLPSQTP